MRPPSLRLLHRVLPAILAAACLSACIRTITGPGPVPAGTWGGPQGNLTVFADSATLDLPCAAGRIRAPLVTAADGTFDVPGLWAPQVGPVRIPDSQWQSARYTGRRDGDVLQMNVQVAGGATIGPLSFARDVVGHFARCV